MAKKNVCDFCLSEGKGIFSRPKKLEDGHYICRNCQRIITSYGLPVKYDLFQILVTAQSNMIDMIMDAYLEKNDAAEAIEKFFPDPEIAMHPGEHCLNAIPASYTVNADAIPDTDAVTSIAEIRRGTIHNIGDGSGKRQAETVKGILYETEAAVYFLSDHIINCHRLGYVKRNTGRKDRIMIATPKKTYTYTVEHADLFFMRERFYQKANAARNHKTKHLIYISGDNQITITPGVYDIPKSLRPGHYRVHAVNDAGLHTRDPFGHVKDYYENEDSIEIPAGGVVECTGEYQLEWIGESDRK